MMTVNKQVSPPTNEPIVDRVAKIILQSKDMLGARDILVSIDGPSAVGKTSICEQVANIFLQESRPVAIISLDYFLIPKLKHTALKKFINGEDLSAEDWALISEKEKKLISPGKECTYERELFWRSKEIENLLKSIRGWADDCKDEAFTYDVYDLWSRETGVLTNFTIRIDVGSIILLDGKLSNWLSFYRAAKYDVTFRVWDNPQTIIRRYFDRKYELTPGTKKAKKVETERAMLFYKLLMWPSWKLYSEQTEKLIDWFVNLDQKLVSRNPSLISKRD